MLAVYVSACVNSLGLILLELLCVFPTGMERAMAFNGEAACAERGLPSCAGLTRVRGTPRCDFLRVQLPVSVERCQVAQRHDSPTWRGW